MHSRSVLSVVFLSVAGVGGVILLVIGGLLAFMVSSGGLYGNANLSDATAAELLAGVCILMFGCLPLAFVSWLAFMQRRRKKLTKWTLIAGWALVIGIMAPVCLDILSTGMSSHRLTLAGLGLLTLPVLPFVLGLMGFLVLDRGVSDD